MGEVVRIPLEPPSAASTLVVHTWEALLADKPLSKRKADIITAYRGGLMPAALVSYFFNLWKLEGY